MNVRMYNCNFGDCFRLNTYENNQVPLFVDFGIHSSSLKKKDRDKRYSEIENDMPEDKDFLLTHYHEDHYEGVIHAKNQGLKFKNVYIPDIWRMHKSVAITKLILLKGLLSRGVLSGGLTLFDFLLAICSSHVHFVSTFDSIQNQYTALWPDRDAITVFPFKYSAYRDWDETTEGELQDIASDLVDLMVRSIASNDGIAYLEGSEQALQTLRGRYVGLGENINSETHKSLEKKLSDWGNDISIVFHSKNMLQMNVLFCGDVSRKWWGKIMDNRLMDTDCIHFRCYKVIKVPHHGTKGYYHDFTELSNSCTRFLIPNGNCRWKIDYRYSLDANYINATNICAGNSCDAFSHGACNCNKCFVLLDKGVLYEDIY